ncbi:MAG: hypothetical protein SFU99_10590 [Saprospiraceae bacterium]|nr:hypothetical protein [Saprospiraceae bacterium]
MKSTFTLMIALFTLLLFACKNEKPPVTNASPEVTPPALNSTTPTPTLAVQHYICPNNCQGSGGPQGGNCPVCGTAYQHNDAFHNQALQQNTQPQQPQAQPFQNAAPPAQNAAGVYHYICSNGCAGGSGAAGNCATCGTALAHNQAYHQ